MIFGGFRSVVSLPSQGSLELHAFKATSASDPERTPSWLCFRSALRHWLPRRALPKFGPVTPKLAPRFARGAADKDVWMIPAFFIDDTRRVTRVAREAAIDEEFIRALT